MTITIRNGTAEDLPEVLDLIRELAAYEKAPAEVSVTLEEMQNWGFGKQPAFEFFVLQSHAKVVGMALYYYKYSTWKGRCLFLEDIIITENERGKGYGKLLFNEVIKVAKKEKVRRMEWQVLEWNEPAIRFYKRYQSDMDGEWINCKLTEAQLQSM